MGNKVQIPASQQIAPVDNANKLHIPASQQIAPVDNVKCEFNPEHHNLFLSHAGEDKPFVRMLHEELKRRKHTPFLDKESLMPGSHFPSTIHTEINKCQVIIVILSENFVIKKWPMLELVAARKRQYVDNRPIILPVFYKLHVNKINMDNLCKWKEEHWAPLRENDNDVNLEAYLKALQDLQKISGIVKSDSEDEFDFAKRVTDAVCRMVTPIKRWANNAILDSHKNFFDKLKSNERHKCTFLGMWGKAGTGKTCIAMALCSHFYQDYCGWVFLVDLSRKNDKVAVGRALYSELHGTKLDSTISEDENVLAHDLEELIKDKSFFLVLDNPTETRHGKDMVEYVLDRLKHCKECKVLITAREEKFLNTWLQPYSNEATVNVVKVPSLDSQAAARILLRTARPDLNWDKLNLKEQGAIQKVCTSNLEGSEFHPHLTKMVGKYISRSGKISEPLTLWPALIEADVEFKKKLDSDIFLWLLSEQFQSMTDRLQAVSIDATLYNVSIETSLSKICDWLSILYTSQADTVWKQLEKVRENGLLDWVDDDEDDPEINTNRFANFAKENSEKWGWFFYQEALDFAPPRPENIQKIALVEGRFQDVGDVLNLADYSNAIALVLSRCENVEQLNVQCNNNMRVLQVDQCKSLREIKGLVDLTNLRKLEISGTAMRVVPSLQGCSKLEELILTYNHSLQCLPQCWSGFPHLTKIDFSCNKSILELPDLSPLAASLHSLDISYCVKLKSAACLSSLTLTTLCTDGCPALKITIMKMTIMNTLMMKMLMTKTPIMIKMVIMVVMIMMMMIKMMVKMVVMMIKMVKMVMMMINMVKKIVMKIKLVEKIKMMMMMMIKMVKVVLMMMKMANGARDDDDEDDEHADDGDTDDDTDSEDGGGGDDDDDSGEYDDDDESGEDDDDEDEDEDDDDGDVEADGDNDKDGEDDDEEEDDDVNGEDNDDDDDMNN